MAIKKKGKKTLKIPFRYNIWNLFYDEVHGRFGFFNRRVVLPHKRGLPARSDCVFAHFFSSSARHRTRNYRIARSVDNNIRQPFLSSFFMLTSRPFLPIHDRRLKSHVVKDHQLENIRAKLIAQMFFEVSFTFAFIRPSTFRLSLKVAINAKIRIKFYPNNFECWRAGKIMMFFHIYFQV